MMTTMGVVLLPIVIGGGCQAGLVLVDAIGVVTESGVGFVGCSRVEIETFLTIP